MSNATAKLVQVRRNGKRAALRAPARKLFADHVEVGNRPGFPSMVDASSETTLVDCESSLEALNDARVFLEIGAG